MKKMTKIERQEKSKKIKFNILLLITILSVMVFIIFKSDLFIINDIEVVGNSKLLKEDIVEYSALPKGENIFRIKTRISRERIEQLPYIKEVEVKRKLPNTIIIDVVERKEIALIKTISTYQVIDIEGYILQQVESEDENLPTLLGLNIDNPQLGANLFEDMEIPNLQSFLEEAHRLYILNLIKDMDLQILDDINITLNDGIDIAFGTLDNVEYRLRLLNEILKDIEKKGIKIKKIVMNKGEHPIIIMED